VNKGQLLIKAWNLDGTLTSVNDFVNKTHFINSDWSLYSNYGIFPMGKLPATKQSGSDFSGVNIGGIEYISYDINTPEPYYFTSLWHAPEIGTVYMRADNEGLGLTNSEASNTIIELPYDFALSEFKVADNLLTNTLSLEAEVLLEKARASIDRANVAASGSLRAVESYQALSFIMPLKEQLVIDASNKSISLNGKRTDFDLNYEGFGSWTSSDFLPTYTAAKEAGFKSLLTNVEWDLISPTQGTYDFSGLDYQIDTAEALGYQIVLNINRNFVTFPIWMQNLSFAELKVQFYENARQIVARYGDRVSLYYPSSELELETNGLSMPQIAELAKEALDGAKMVDPTKQYGIYMSASAYVNYQINPGVNANYFTSIELIDYLVKNGVNYDFMAIQMQYSTTFAPIDIQRFKEILEGIYEVAQLPIYMGETGYSSKTEDYGIDANFYWHGGLNQQAQYEWADGTLRSLYALPFVKGYYWVHLDADDNDYGSNYLSSLIGTGFTKTNGEINKVQSAFKSFTSQIETQIPGISSAANSIVKLEGSGQSAAISTSFNTNLKVIVRDFLGNPTENVMVVFTAPTSVASGIFEGNVSTVTVSTDSDGYAAAPVFSANATAGSYSVNASVIATNISTDFNLTNQ